MHRIDFCLQHIDMGISKSIASSDEITESSRMFSLDLLISQAHVLGFQI